MEPTLNIPIHAQDSIFNPHYWGQGWAIPQMPEPLQSSLWELWRILKKDPVGGWNLEEEILVHILGFLGIRALDIFGCVTPLLKELTLAHLSRRLPKYEKETDFSWVSITEAIWTNYYLENTGQSVIRWWQE